MVAHYDRDPALYDGSRGTRHWLAARQDASPAISPTVPAATVASGKTQSSFPHAPVWPLVCWAVLVGIMAAGEVGRLYRTKNPITLRPATGAFGTFRSSDEPTALQHARAEESGRGRHAEAPWQIPWRGWKDVLWRT